MSSSRSLSTKLLNPLLHEALNSPPLPLEHNIPLPPWATRYIDTPLPPLPSTPSRAAATNRKRQAKFYPAPSPSSSRFSDDNAGNNSFAGSPSFIGSSSITADDSQVQETLSNIPDANVLYKNKGKRREAFLFNRFPRHIEHDDVPINTIPETNIRFGHVGSNRTATVDSRAPTSLIHLGHHSLKSSTDVPSVPTLCLRPPSGETPFSTSVEIDAGPSRLTSSRIRRSSRPPASGGLNKVYLSVPHRTQENLEAAKERIQARAASQARGGAAGVTTPGAAINNLEAANEPTHAKAASQARGSAAGVTTPGAAINTKTPLADITNLGPLHKKSTTRIQGTKDGRAIVSPAPAFRPVSPGPVNFGGGALFPDGRYTGLPVSVDGKLPNNASPDSISVLAEPRMRWITPGLPTVTRHDHGVVLPHDSIDVPKELEDPMSDDKVDDKTKYIRGIARARYFERILEAANSRMQEEVERVESSPISEEIKTILKIEIAAHWEQVSRSVHDQIDGSLALIPWVILKDKHGATKAGEVLARKLFKKSNGVAKLSTWTRRDGSYLKLELASHLQIICHLGSTAFAHYPSTSKTAEWRIDSTGLGYWGDATRPPKVKSPRNLLTFLSFRKKAGKDIDVAKALYGI